MLSLPASRPMIDFVKLCYAANHPPLFIGRHGVGKSQLLEQAARELGIEFISRDLSLMEPPDLVGLPRIDGEVTRYLPPSFLPREGRGLLVFEELNRCERYMQAPCLQLLTTRTLNDYHLPPGWLPAAAINPPDDDYDIHELDAALISRFVCINVVPDRKGWLDWAARGGVHAAVLSYVRADATVFQDPGSNPRAWQYVSDVLHAADRDRSPRRVVLAAISGLVGDRRAEAFFANRQRAEEPFSADDILSEYQRHREKVTAWIAQGRLDLVAATLRAVLTFLQPQSDFDAVKAHGPTWRNLGKFLADLPGDLNEQANSFFAERSYPLPGSQAGRSSSRRRGAPAR